MLNDMWRSAGVASSWQSVGSVSFQGGTGFQLAVAPLAFSRAAPAFSWLSPRLRAASAAQRGATPCCNVRARWNVLGRGFGAAKGKWYPAVVIVAYADASVDVRYADGDCECVLSQHWTSD